MATSKCTRCGTILEKNTDNFYKRKTSPDGFNRICKNCLKTSKPRKYKHWNNGKLLCLKCNKYKDISQFDKDSKKVHRDYKSIICKECKKDIYQLRKEERARNSTLERLLTERFLSIKERSKKYNMKLDFDKKYLYELWNKQKGRCAISNIEMTYIARKGRISTNLSIDRIDSSKGYSKDNIQLVCMAINQMKNNLSLEELVYFCKEILINNEYTNKKIA